MHDFQEQCQTVFHAILRFGNKAHISYQAQIHTGFHHFMEIGQICCNKYIIINNKKLFKLKSRDEIICRFARLHPRRMELANILCE